MKERVYSLETEYALTHIPEEGQAAMPPEKVFGFLADALDPKLKAPGSQGNIMFLANGAKFYDDNGHPEWSCPECRSASDAALWDKAGERMLAKLGEDAEKRLGGQILIAKNNVDAQGHFFGCHENYLVERKPDFVHSEQEFFLLLVRHLVPFLVTRQIYTGTGKVGLLQSTKESIFGYQIFQRADAIQRIVSEETRSERAIINTRDESLANPLQYRRLHLILGDSNLSEWASFMKLGTTGIVLRLIEENFIDQDVVLADPLTAIREISYDLTCTRPIALKNGEELTAIEIQRRYLIMAEAYFDSTNEIDEETTFILEQWQEVLQKLEENPRQLADRVDWVSKKQLLERHVESHDLHWEDPEIRELDVKFHDIHRKRGLFNQLQDSGIISSFLDEKEIEHAKLYPPDNTRAKVRSDCIRAAHRWRMALEVEWDRATLDGHTIALNEPLDFFHLEVDTLLADGQTLAFLGAMLQHPNPEVRRQTVYSVGQIDGDEASNLLIHALDADDHWLVRAAVVEALSSRPEEKVYDVIERALHDKHFIVRRRAKDGLQRS